MTSEVYVHVRHRGGATDLAGRYRRVAPAAGQPYGEFAYVGSWLRNDHGRAFALDPEHLPLQPGPFRSTGRGRLPGVLADATPDRWGRRLIAHRRPVDRSPMTAGDWLLATGDERVGCLAFSETRPRRHPIPATRPRPTSTALRTGSNVWNAVRRPKGWRPASGARGQAWAAPGRRPSWNTRAPYGSPSSSGGTTPTTNAAPSMRRCAWHPGAGSTPPRTKLLPVGPRKVILVKRFDRDPVTHEPTAHYLSGLTALGLDETSDSGSYPELALFLLRHGARNVSDRHELFRRMVFNVLCGNRDDHLKNHAVLRRDGAWRLSPAFDVVPQPDMDPQQAIGVGRSGSYPTIGNGLTRAADFDLSQDDARGLVADLAARMRSWRQDFAADGVDAVTIGRLARAFSTELERPG